MPASYRVALAFAGIAALAGLVAAFEYERTHVLDSEGRVATATVVGVDRWVKGGPEAEIRFTTSEGREILTSLQEFTWPLQERGQVEVEYAARDPYYYVRDPVAAGTELRFYGRATAVLVVVAVAIPLLRRPVLRLRERAERAAKAPPPPPRPRYRTYVDQEGGTRREQLN